MPYSIPYAATRPVGIVCLLIVSACGGAGGGSTGMSLPEFDACSLISAADASDVLGGSASEPEQYTKLDRRDETMGTAVSSCVYTRDDSFRTLSLVVTYRSAELPATFEALRAESETATGSAASISRELFATSEEVAGLGDFAYWSTSIGSLTVYANRHYEISINVDPESRGDAASARPAAVDVARRVLGKL